MQFNISAISNHICLLEFEILHQSSEIHKNKYKIKKIEQTFVQGIFLFTFVEDENRKNLHKKFEKMNITRIKNH